MENDDMTTLRFTLLLTGLIVGTSVATTGFTDDKDDATDRAKEVIEEREGEEKADKSPEVADVGEASYNIEDCAPVDGDADVLENCEKAKE